MEIFPEDLYGRTVEEISNILTRETREIFLIRKYKIEILTHMRTRNYNMYDDNVKIDWDKILGDAKDSVVVDRLFREQRAAVVKFLKKEFPEEFI